MVRGTTEYAYINFNDFFHSFWDFCAISRCILMRQTLVEAMENVYFQFYDI